jgi:adenylylsulfate kinase
MRAKTVFLNRTVGVGKSTTANVSSALLVEGDTPNATIELDALRAAWPAPADDPFNSEPELANLRPFAANTARLGRASCCLQV